MPESWQTGVAVACEWCSMTHGMKKKLASDLTSCYNAGSSFSISTTGRPDIWCRVLVCTAQPPSGEQAAEEATLASAWEAFHCHDGVTACIGRAGDNRNAIMLSYIVRAPPQLVAKVCGPLISWEPHECSISTLKVELYQVSARI